MQINIFNPVVSFVFIILAVGLLIPQNSYASCEDPLNEIDTWATHSAVRVFEGKPISQKDLKSSIGQLIEISADYTYNGKGVKKGSKEWVYYDAISDSEDDVECSGEYPAKLNEMELFIVQSNVYGNKHYVTRHVHVGSADYEFVKEYIAEAMRENEPKYPRQLESSKVEHKKLLEREIKFLKSEILILQAELKYWRTAK